MIEYKNIAGSVTLKPIKNAVFSLPNGDGATDVYLDHLEKESHYRVTPVTRNLFSGGVKTLGYRLEANLYVMHNADLQTLITQLNIFKDLKAKVLSSEDADHYHIKIDSENAINKTAEGYVLICNHNGYIENFTIEIEAVEFRPRAIVKIVFFQKNTHLNIFN